MDVSLKFVPMTKMRFPQTLFLAEVGRTWRHSEVILNRHIMSWTMFFSTCEELMQEDNVSADIRVRFGDIPEIEAQSRFVSPHNGARVNPRPTGVFL